MGQEHLLTQASEECAEIIHRIAKALRFGEEEVQLAQPFTNRSRIRQEYTDLVAVMEMLGIEPLGELEKNKKKRKVEQYLDYAKKSGTLTS